jgi:hypothetical protein
MPIKVLGKLIDQHTAVTNEQDTRPLLDGVVQHGQSD